MDDLELQRQRDRVTRRVLGAIAIVAVVALMRGTMAANRANPSPSPAAAPAAPPTESFQDQLGRHLPTVVAQANERVPGLFREGYAQPEGGCRVQLADPVKWEALTYYDRERITTIWGELCSSAARDDGRWDADFVRTVVVDDLGIEFAAFTKAAGALVIPHPDY